MKSIDKLQQWWRHRHLPQSLNTDQVCYQLAAASSAQYVMTHMRTVPNFDWDIDLLKFAVTQIDPRISHGNIVEFGVASGRTIRHIAKARPQHIVYGFDSFAGLPETWSWLFPKGSFAQRIPKVPKNVVLQVGNFADTIPAWTRTVKGPVSFVHIDCDLYSSTKTVLELLNDRIVPGTIIVFDEYLNHLGWEDDEFLAWQQAGRKYEYIGRVGHHQQVAVRVL